MLRVIPAWRRLRAPIVLAVVIALSAVAAPARSVDDEDVEQARLEAEEARRQAEEAAAARAAALESVDAAATAYEQINGEYQTLVAEMAQVQRSLDQYAGELARIRERARHWAVEAYMAGTTRADELIIVDASSIERAVLARQVYAEAAAEDMATLEDLEVVTAHMEQLEARLDEDTERASALRIEAEAVATRMYELLDEAEVDLDVAQVNLAEAEATLVETERQAEEERLRQEAIRMAMLGPAAGVPENVTPGFICPVVGVSAFTDTWGAPRSYGRGHIGTDLMAPRGTPLVAVADGIVVSRLTVLGGNTVRLYADYGVYYVYAHLDSYPADFVDGQWVPKGTVIGYMGDTGNAAPGAYHLHFEIHPDGAGAVNPYPTVARACPRP
jgi:murein DD-endopeptidase MepM/ murein hydrolase activator NlpD